MFNLKPDFTYNINIHTWCRSNSLYNGLIPLEASLSLSLDSMSINKMIATVNTDNLSMKQYLGKKWT